MDELVGRADLLKRRDNITGRAANVDLSNILNTDFCKEKICYHEKNLYNFELEKTLDEKVLDGASVQDLKTAFYKDNDLEEIAQKSLRVQANAISGKYAATVSNYTDSGTYSNSALSSFLKSI